MTKTLLKPPKEEKIHVQMNLEGEVAREVRRLREVYGISTPVAVRHLCMEALEARKKAA